MRENNYYGFPSLSLAYIEKDILPSPNPPMPPNEVQDETFPP
ncbi:hypothetical protein [Microseira sp. BLCC-F43]